MSDTTKNLYTTPSPSALALLDMCEARAGARYVAGLKEPEGMKAKLGTRCHSIGADYLSQGTPPPRAETFVITKARGKATTFYPGRIVWNVLNHLPPAGTVPNVEKKISLTWRGITFHPASSIDWENEQGYGDHKFTTDVKYAKTPEELRTDAQRVIYAADWFQRHDADVTQGQWTYGQFDLKASKKVIVPATRAEIAALMDDVIIPKAEKLLGWVAKGVDWRSLPKNVRACDKFPPDGCPYARECPRTKQERVQMVMASSFMEKMRAQKAAKLAAAGGAAAEQTRDDRAAQRETIVKAAANDVVTEDVEHDAEEAAAAIAGHINPPGEVGAVLDVDESESAEDVPAEPPAAAEQPAPKKRGRKPGSTNKPKSEPAAAAEAKIAAAEAASTDGAYTQEMTEAYSEAQQAAGGKKPLILLVDCLPLKGFDDVTYASDLIAQAHDHIKRGDGTPEGAVLDYRLIDYGKGAGFLSACIAGLLEDLPANTVLVLETNTPEGQLALQPCMAAATSVIRGVA